MKKLFSSVLSFFLFLLLLTGSRYSVSAGGVPPGSIDPMEDLVEFLRQTPQRSIRLRADVPYALPMLDIGKQSPTGGYIPEIMDIDGDGSDDLVLSLGQGPERFQMVLLFSKGAYYPTYLCGFTNANDETGQFTYRGDCADVR